MKKNVSLFAILGIALSLYAQNNSAPLVVLEEDFSLCTAGTPEKPDTMNIAPGTNYVYEVDAAYTHQPHWSGYYVFQAGGCVAVSEYDYYGYIYGGHISTPEVLSHNDRSNLPALGVVLARRARKATVTSP